MSWNPSPTIGSASWSGNPPVATKTQLLSTSAGIIQNIALSTVSTFETITVNQWISTPLLYVSDIKGYSVDISGLSSVTANFSLVQTSSIAFTAPTIDAGVKVNVDFNLGSLVYNALLGTGAMLFETAVGIGIGAGATFVGIGNGIAALIYTKDPVNNPTYINTNNFEVVGGSTQLQVSTLGNAYPVYSSIMRYVSTNVPNQQPGVPEFQSTLFSPGQICIRSISDPIPIVASSSNVLGSTLQQFGEWVPLIGLEPENIEAQSVSTVNLKADNVLMTEAVVTSLIGGGILAENVLQVGKINAPGSLILPYETYLEQQIGATSYARLLGAVNYWYQQSDQDIVWTKPGAPGVPINMELSMGSNGFESYLQVSSILSRGNITANSGYFSTLVVNALTVVSSFSTILNVTASNVLSTNIVTANLVSTNILEVKNVYPFQISSLLGNPTGPFDITKNDTVVSTTYNQISSLTQNMFSYSLNIGVQDQATFNIYNGQSQLALYSVTPSNINQWASTLLIFDTFEVPGQIDLGVAGQWSITPGDLGAAPGGATFDVRYTYSNQYANTFIITEQSNKDPNNPGISTFFNFPGPAGFTGLSTFRFTLPPSIAGTRSGWWQMTTPAGAPYTSSNNNTFQMYQDINDTYIQGTDRLHLVAGDLFLDGTVNSSNMTVNTLYASNAELANASFNNFTVLSSFTASTISTNLVLANNVIVNPVTGGFDSYYFKPSTISFVSGVQSVTPFQSQFYVNSSDYIPQYSFIPSFMGSNEFTSYNYQAWNQTLWRNTTPAALETPGVYLGDVQTSRGPYSAKFWIDNTATGSPYYPLPIYVITSAGSNQLGLVTGNTYALIQTSNGVTWTITSNVPNPQGFVGGNFSNITTLTQSIGGTTLQTNQNCFLQSPNQTITTGSLYLYADQIRTNSRRYGSVETQGIGSYPIGIENTVYIDANISWTQQVATLWYSDATNALVNVTGDLLYDVNSWIVQIIPSRFRTNDSSICAWDVQPTVLPVAGGGFCWGYNRYIQVNAPQVSGPGSGANNWNYIIAIPKNYCTYN